jgi:hypothetical protein
MSERTLSDRAIALTLGAATLLGLAAGLGTWVATPRQLQLASYGLFGAASVVLITILVLVGLAIGTPSPGSDDGGSDRDVDHGPLPSAPGKVPDVLDELDYELELLLRHS